MSGFLNLSFEDGAAGEATGWSVLLQSSAEEFLSFDGAPAEGFEAGWSNDAYTVAFGVGDLDQLVFAGPSPVEGFEAGWSNDAYATGISGTLAAFHVGGTTPTYATTATHEDFENLWGGISAGDSLPYLHTFADVTPDAAPGDDFEAGWSNDAYVAVWSGVTPGTAAFSGARAEAIEGFEYLKLDEVVIVNFGAAGKMHQPGHGLSVGGRVRFRNETGQLPTPLDDGFDYWVSTVIDSDNFNISTTSGGATLVPSTDGTGATLLSAPTEFWTLPLP